MTPDPSVAAAFLAGASFLLALVAIFLCVTYRAKADAAISTAEESVLRLRSAVERVERTYEKMWDLYRSDRNDTYRRSDSPVIGREEEALDSHAEDRVDSPLEDLRTVLNRMTEGRGFTAKDRDHAFNLLHQIRNTDLEGEGEFVLLLEQFLDLMMAADQDVHVEVADNWFGSITTKHADINNTILQNLAHRMLGSGSVAKPRDLERFRRHLNAAGPGNAPLALCVWCVYSFVQQDAEEVDRTLKRVEALDDVQVLSFLDVLNRYCEESRIAKVATERIKAMASNSRSFREAEEQRLEALRDRIGGAGSAAERDEAEHSDP